MDRLIRTRAVRNMLDAISTLSSLSRQLTSLTTMVVKDHINTIVQSSLNSLELAKESLKKGDYEMASRHARDAIVSSESAFFDPTMVPMLYFPDEHKLAIYMPFFVPIALPLLKALYEEFKAYRYFRSLKPKIE